MNYVKIMKIQIYVLLQSRVIYDWIDILVSENSSWKLGGNTSNMANMVYMGESPEIWPGIKYFSTDKNNKNICWMLWDEGRFTRMRPSFGAYLELKTSISLITIEHRGIFSEIFQHFVELDNYRV